MLIQQEISSSRSTKKIILIQYHATLLAFRKEIIKIFNGVPSLWKKYHFGDLRLFLPHSLLASFLKANKLNVMDTNMTFSRAQKIRNKIFFKTELCIRINLVQSFLCHSPHVYSNCSCNFVDENFHADTSRAINEAALCN